MHEKFIQDSKAQPTYSNASQVSPLPLAPGTLHSSSTLRQNTSSVLLRSTESHTPTLRCPKPSFDDLQHKPHDPHSMPSLIAQWITVFAYSTMYTNSFDIPSTPSPDSPAVFVNICFRKPFLSFGAPVWSFLRYFILPAWSSTAFPCRTFSPVSHSSHQLGLKLLQRQKYHHLLPVRCFSYSIQCHFFNVVANFR